jgi:hypothetical protein
MYIRTFTAAQGLDFTVILLDPGEPGPTEAPANDDHAIVQFYDVRHTVPSPPFTTYGQLVSSYWLETILPGDAGINLRVGSPEWVIDAITLNEIRSWLREKSSRPSSPRTDLSLRSPQLPHQ